MMNPTETMHVIILLNGEGDYIDSKVCSVDDPAILLAQVVNIGYEAEDGVETIFELKIMADAIALNVSDHTAQKMAMFYIFGPVNVECPWMESSETLKEVLAPTMEGYMEIAMALGGIEYN